MVSILLGLFLSAGIVSAYLESKRNYAAEDEMARMQENGRFATNLLKRELTLAGFFGGSLKADEIPAKAVGGTDCASGNWALTATNPIELVNDHNSTSSPVTINSTTLTCLDGTKIEPITDLLSIKRTAGEPSLRSGVYANGFTSSTSKRWYMRILNFGEEKEWVEQTPADLKDPNGPYDPNDIYNHVAYWETYVHIYYIRNHSDPADTTDGIPTLCVKSLEGNTMATQCLVEGVEDMQVEFGIDTTADGVPNQYKAAPTAGDIANVVSARVYFLLRSIDEIAGYQNTKTYTLGQKAVAAKNDGFLRRVFTTTVQVRNATMPVG